MELKTINKATFIFIAIAFIAAMLLCINRCNKPNGANSLNMVLFDSLTQFKNKHGQAVSTIAILHGTVAELNKMGAAKDRRIAELQKLVDKNTLSATVHGTSTHSNTQTGTQIIKHDTIIKNDTAYLYPTYHTTFTDLWRDVSATANKDSFNIDFKVYNKYTHKVHYTKDKWYKEKHPVITVTNLNPYTETTELSNFTVKQPQKSKYMAFLAGAITGLAATKLILNK